MATSKVKQVDTALEDFIGLTYDINKIMNKAEVLKKDIDKKPVRTTVFHRYGAIFGRLCQSGHLSGGNFGLRQGIE